MQGLGHRPSLLAWFMSTALLVGCAGQRSVQPEPPVPQAAADPEPEPPSQAPPTPPPVTSTAPDQHAEFAQQHRLAARKAQQLKHWADAAWHWDVLLALDPQDAEASDQHQLAQDAAKAEIAVRLPKAQAAQQRGDMDAAKRLYLDVLLRDPHHIEAAEALRRIERARTRQGVVMGSFGGYSARQARQPEPALPPNPTSPESSASGKLAVRTDGKATSGNRMPPTAKSAVADGDGRQAPLARAERLMSEGDWSGAIALLKPVATGPQALPGARARLAAAYLGRARPMEAIDTVNAEADLRAALALQPNSREAKARLARLQASGRQATGAPIKPRED